MITRMINTSKMAPTMAAMTIPAMAPSESPLTGLGEGGCVVGSISGATRSPVNPFCAYSSLEAYVRVQGRLKYSELRVKILHLHN